MVLRRRFVGLLLAPRLLMSGKLSEQALVDAMGLEFLERLLLPLSQSETVRSSNRACLPPHPHRNLGDMP